VRSGAAPETERARLATRPGVRHTGSVRLSSLLSLAFALALVPALGCSSPAKTPPAGPGSAAARADDPTCPVLVAGTSVTVEDTDTGAALVFVTTTDAAAVVTRARALAEAHNAHHAKMEAKPATPDGAKDPHAGHAMGSASAAKPTMGTMIGAHSTAEVTEIPNGARVTFTAHDPAALQAELRMHVQHLSGGTCEM
jgi:hypothetical protein